MPATANYLIWFSTPQRDLEKDPGLTKRIACATRGMRNLHFTDPGWDSGDHRSREMSLLRRNPKKQRRGASRGIKMSQFLLCALSSVFGKRFVFIQLPYGYLSFFPFFSEFLGSTHQSLIYGQGNADLESAKNLGSLYHNL